MPSGSLSHSNCCKNYPVNHKPAHVTVLDKALWWFLNYLLHTLLGMALEILHDQTSTYFSNVTLYHTLTRTVLQSPQVTSWAPILLALLEFFPLPENPFLLTLLDLLLLSFRSKMKWQVLFKDFPTSSTFLNLFSKHRLFLPSLYFHTTFPTHLILYLLNCQCPTVLNKCWMNEWMNDT